MRASPIVMIAAWLCASVIVSLSAVGAAADACTDEATALVQDEAELPRLEAVSPADRPPYCITLETIIAFSRRLATHVAHCPDSAYAPAAADWDKTRADYSKLFVRRRCKPAIPH